jgi:hypothetical protein
MQVSGTVYTKDVLALSDHLFERFPTLSGLEILAIAAETVEFYKGRDDTQQKINDYPDVNGAVWDITTKPTGAWRDRDGNLFAGHPFKGV